MHNNDFCVSSNEVSDVPDYNRMFHGIRYNVGWPAHGSMHT